MKSKPWESPIPYTHSYNYIDYNNQYNKTWLKKQPSKYIIIQFTNEEFNNALDWIKKNKIPLCNWEIIVVERLKTKYVFRFKNDIDAMAFKLRWL